MRIRPFNGISYNVHRAETLGIVGESGCGKSTLARAILGLKRARRGQILWRGEDLTQASEEALRRKRREIQLIFQDPSGSLDPRMSVGTIIAEPLKTFYPSMSRLQVRERVMGILKMVGLGPEYINRYPHEMRSEEHTSELQSRGHLVCRLLLAKKKHHATGATHMPTPRVQRTS